jgi:DNA-binding NtrC family response regulator
MKSRIFIFEDDENTIKLYKVHFKDLFDITIASTFSNAVYTLENSSSFDAYILDVYDPHSRFNGTDLINLIKSDKIIFVTAFDMRFQMSEKYRKFAYMQKPVFSYKELIELIKKVVDEKN